MGQGNPAVSPVRPAGPPASLSSQRSTFATVLSAVFLLLAVVLHGAQQSSGVDPVAIPVDQEPRHRLVFSNPFVRVIDALFPPLYVSSYHTHAADNVAVTILSGRTDAQGQSRVGFAGFSRGGYSHVITNPATVPMRFIDVELVAADRGSGEAPDAFENHEVVLSNTRVRVFRVKVDAAQSVADHRHSAGFLSVTVRGGDGPGTWRWHGSADAPTPLRAGRQALEIVEIEPR